jgi:hypothetical protein
MAVAVQVAFFAVLLAFGFNAYHMDPMKLENWVFGFAIADVTLFYLYAGMEWGFSALPRPSEDEQVAVAFSRLDLNQDGAISRDEARRGGLGEAFDTFDTDHDGKLAPEEFHLAYTCGALRYGLKSKLKSFFTLGLAPIPSKG